MVTQVTYAVHLMHTEGYNHNDLHSGNVGVVKAEPNENIINLKLLIMEAYYIMQFG